MRLRSQWTIVGVFAFVLTVVAILLVIVVQQPLRIAWHRSEMERAWQESQSATDPTESYLRFQSHLETLAKLGAVTKQEYRFVHLKVPTPESRHFFKRLMARDCPPLIDLNAAHPKSPEPIVLTLWYEHEFRDEWQDFLKAADTANYREKFMAAAHSDPPE